MQPMQRELNLSHVKDGRQAKVNSSMEKKYTANEWAQIEGGHTIEEKTSSLNLSIIGDLNESKLFRTRQQAQTTDARDMIDFAFLNMLTLQLLYSEYETAPIAKAYAAKTAQYQGFSNYQQAGSDLYIALNSVLTGNVGGDDNAMIQLKKLNVPYNKIKDYLLKVGSGQPFPNTAGFLFNLERGLDISDSNYRELRRSIANWNTLDTFKKQLVVTRLLQFYRTKAIRSELYTILNDFAKRKNLELKNVKNAEKGSLVSKAAINAAKFGAGYFAGRAFGKWIVG